jgi:hypothetical protein
LYRVDEEQPRREYVRKTLGVLGALGGGMSGNYCVMLCGSSASTESLIQSKTAHLREAFPLVCHGVPDLNGTKFTRCIIQTASCAASEEVAKILATVARLPVLPTAMQQRARLLTFFVGTTPRALFAATTVPDAVLRIEPFFPGLSSEAAAFYDVLLSRFVTANGRLLDMTRANGAVQLSALTDPQCEWELAVTPLAWRDVAKAWAEHATAEGLHHARDSAYLLRLVSSLADAHMVHLEDAPGGTRVWPMTASQVVTAGSPLSYDSAAALRALLQPLLKLAQDVTTKVVAQWLTS